MPLGILIGALMAVYASVWSVPFGHVDDYLYLNWEIKGNSGFIGMAALNGRPLSGYLTHLLLHAHRSIAGMGWVRATAVLFLCGFAALLYGWLRRCGWSRSLAASTTVLVGTVPGMQVFICTALGATYPLGCAAGGAAAILTGIATRPGRASARCVAVIGSLMLLIAAVLIYQPAAMVFWVFIAAELFARPNDPRPQFIASVLVTVAALAGGFLAYHLIGPWLVPHAAPDVRGSMLTLGQLPAKTAWFLQYPLLYSLNLYNLFPRLDVACAVGLFIVPGLYLFADGSPRHRLTLLTLALAMIPLTCVPILLISADAGCHRAFMPLESLVALFCMMALRGWWKRTLRAWPLPDWLPMLLAIGAAIFAARMVIAYWVWPQATELRFVQSALNDDRLSHATRIDIILSSDAGTIAPAAIMGEFGSPSTTADYGAVPMVKVLLWEQHRPLWKMPVVVVPDASEARPSDLLIDCTQLRNFAWNEKSSK